MKPQSMTHKILARAAGRDSVTTGEIIEARIDRCFAHDPVVEQLRRLFYEEFGADAKVWDPDRVVLIEDHLVPAKDSASRRMLMAMPKFAREQGINRYYPYGANYGISHILMCEEGYARPGEIVLGPDSHSVTYGAFNTFGTGVGLIDLLNVFRTGTLWFRVPEIIQVRIDGQLPEGVQGKDIMLRLIGDIGMDGASGKTLEFRGSTIDAMSVDERMTLCNMVVEAGAKNGIMELSPTAHAYLAARVPQVPEPVSTDAGFEYSRVITYRAEELVPMVALPHSPANVKRIHEVRERRIKVNHVYVGSCTGAKYEDLETVARELAGRQVSRELHLMVVPASMSIYRRALESGVIGTLIDAGAVVESPGCKACYGAHGGVLGDDEVCLSTMNRNFRGRMGNPRSFIYLSSPYVAARSALAGYITDGAHE